MNSSLLIADRRRFHEWLGRLRSSLLADQHEEHHAPLQRLDLDLQDQRERILREVTSALERLETGHFGSCEACGRPISRNRLLAVPCSHTCSRCARRQREHELVGAGSRRN